MEASQSFGRGSPASAALRIADFYLFMFGIEFSHVVIAAFRLIRISDRKMGEKKRKEKKRNSCLHVHKELCTYYFGKNLHL